MPTRRERQRKKPKQPRRPRGELCRSVAGHLGRLGVANVEEYLEWCRRHGFPATTDKGRFAREREQQHHQELSVRAVLLRHRRQGDPAAVCRAVLAGELALGEVAQPGLRAVCAPLAGVGLARPQLVGLDELLRVVARRGRFLRETRAVGGVEQHYTRGLVEIARHRRAWRRPLEDWRPGTKSRSRQFSSLLRHLFAAYPVPLFLDGAWLGDRDRDRRSRLWFLHIAAGHNPRTGPSPTPLTKREAHHLLRAPADFSVGGAVRWAQLHALGGGERLSRAVAGTPLAGSFREETFWRTFLQFLARHPMLDPNQVGPLYDYVDSQRFPDFHGNPAPQPNFTMRGRTVEALLRQVERWHAQLHREQARGPQLWPASGRRGFSWNTGVHRPRTWRIRELCSVQELRAEGRAMRHCVSSYAQSCAAGRCSIWTLELETDEGIEKHLTIEVQGSGTIVQARGKCNAPPKPKGRDVLTRWAEQEGLRLSSWV